MKFIALLLLGFALFGCATKSAVSSDLKYGKLLGLSIGSSTENDVIHAFGLPSSRIDKKGYYTLNYSDSKTGFQRVSLNFLSTSQKLSGFVWIPFQGETEASVDGAKAGFRGAVFKALVQSDDNPHAPLETTSLVDAKSGITILLSPNKCAVEAIAMYDVNNRLPAAATSRKSPSPYTF